MVDEVERKLELRSPYGMGDVVRPRGET